MKIRKQNGFYIYMILYELSFKMNFYETSLGNDINQAFGDLNNVPATSFIKVYINM